MTSTPTEADILRVCAFIDGSEWVFAKTMPKNPHWYTLKRKADPGEFEWFVMFIREHGYTQKWGKDHFTYVDVGEYQYWTMGSPLEKTILINRAEVKAQRLMGDGVFER